MTEYLRYGISLSALTSMILRRYLKLKYNIEVSYLNAVSDQISIDNNNVNEKEIKEIIDKEIKLKEK
jgi:hypothetical protein